MTIWFVWYLPNPSSPTHCPLAGVFSSEEKAIEFKGKAIAANIGTKADWWHGVGTIDVPLMEIHRPKKR